MADPSARWSALVSVKGKTYALHSWIVQLSHTIREKQHGIFACAVVGLTVLVENVLEADI